MRRKLAISIIDKFLFKVQYGNTRTRNNPEGLKSSNVWKYKYDDKKLELVIQFQDGETYTYSSVDLDTFNDFISGNALPTTSGFNEWGSWTEGVGPSIGAYVKELTNYTKGGKI